MFERFRLGMITVLGIVLCLFTLVEVNFPFMEQDISRLAIFVMLGMVLCFLIFPMRPRFEDDQVLRIVDCGLAILAAICCLYVVVNNESRFSFLWFDGKSLGNRAGNENNLDMIVGLVGLGLVLEVTRRAIGWIVPILTLLIVLHSFYGYLSDARNLKREANVFGVVTDENGESIPRKSDEPPAWYAVGNFPAMPAWLLPQSGEGLRPLSSTTFLKGVFGIPAGVMFKYVFLFVIFGAFLEISGATQFIIDFARRMFSRVTGGPALVSVVGSGMMGSLSGSAVANAMMTGSFTIPMMRDEGFERHTAGGITAAAATGGALVPPVMGAGAYMMLELVEPQVSFFQIAQAAVIPACLYYFSLIVIVYLYSKRQKQNRIIARQEAERVTNPIRVFDGLVFFAALGTLIGLLLVPVTPFRAVTGSLAVILFLTCFRNRLGEKVENTPSARYSMLAAFAGGLIAFVVYSLFFGDRLADSGDGKKVFEVALDAIFAGMFAMMAMALAHPVWRPIMVQALSKSAKNGVALVAASACVGIIIGVVTQTGVASEFSSNIKSIVESSLLLALIGIMVCSIILGMGVPSVVCYLLVATLMATLLGDMGVIPLGAHLFIFYFGMMSMVTPPVALAAYASASIAQAKIMHTAFAAFRFALVGFTLPYMFIYRPALMLMNADAWQAWMDAPSETAEQASVKEELLNVANSAYPALPDLAIGLTTAVFGIFALAAAIAGYLGKPLNWILRSLLMVSAGLLLLPQISVGGKEVGVWVNLAGGILFLVVGLISVMGRSNERSPSDATRQEM